MFSVGSDWTYTKKNHDSPPKSPAPTYARSYLVVTGCFFFMESYAYSISHNSHKEVTHAHSPMLCITITSVHCCLIFFCDHILNTSNDPHTGWSPAPTPLPRRTSPWRRAPSQPPYPVQDGFGYQDGAPAPLQRPRRVIAKVCTLVG